MRVFARMILALALASALFLPLASPLARASTTLCNTGSDSWTDPRNGAQVHISTTACGTLDSSTNYFSSSSNSVSSSTTDPSIVALNSNYTYFGFCSTISHCHQGDSYTYLVTIFNGTVYPSNTQTFKAKQAQCIETNPFDLAVKDTVSGVVHYLSAVAMQKGTNPNASCPI